MTVQEAIEKLQSLIDEGLDPKTTLCVGNKEVYFFETKPAYYDGSLQQIVQDQNKEPYYNIVGAKITDQGTKCCVIVMGVEDVILDNPEIPIDLEINGEQSKKTWAKKIKKWRKEAQLLISGSK